MAQSAVELRAWADEPPEPSGRRLYTQPMKASSEDEANLRYFIKSQGGYLTCERRLQATFLRSQRLHWSRKKITTPPQHMILAHELPTLIVLLREYSQSKKSISCGKTICKASVLSLTRPARIVTLPPQSIDQPKATCCLYCSQNHTVKAAK